MFGFVSEERRARRSLTADDSHYALGHGAGRQLKCEGGKWPDFDVESLESDVQESAGTPSPFVLVSISNSSRRTLTEAPATYVEVSVTDGVTGR